MFSKSWQGQYGKGGHDFNHGCCDMRMTWRLAGRLVPIAIEPFNFVGIANGRGSRVVGETTPC